jgi:tetratricopeptide (TPR) repeat protein
MGVFILVIIAIAFLALAVYGFIDEAQRKKRLADIQAEYEEKIRQIHNPTPAPVIDYSTAPVKVFDYGIDMSKVNIMSAEKNMMQSVSQQQRASSDPAYAYQLEIESAWKRGDYDFVRAQLQKIAHTMVGSSVSPEEKKRFTDLMKSFAKDDPLYNDVMSRLTPLLNEHPGMLQSQIYKGQPDHIKEQIRYVLYFANELGHIRRVKKGNSYELYPPDDSGNVDLAVDMGVSMTLSFGGDEETATLGRQATVLKNLKDWDGAIVCLQKMQVRMWQSPIQYPVDTWCRLALILQQAGRFDESEREFEKLLAELPALARKQSFMDDPSRSFGKNTSKKSIYNQIIKTHSKLINDNWALSRKREQTKIARQEKAASKTKDT